MMMPARAMRHCARHGSPAARVGGVRAVTKPTYWNPWLQFINGDAKYSVPSFGTVKLQPVSVNKTMVIGEISARMVA